MKNEFVKKIIVTLTIFSLLTPQIILPLKIEAAEKINWENPNKNGDNPYKIKLTDTFNAKTLVDVVGCTGIVDKASKAVIDFAKDTLKRIMFAKLKKAAIKFCETAKKTAIASVASAMNLNLTDIAKEIKCNVSGGKTTLTSDSTKALSKAAGITNKDDNSSDTKSDSVNNSASEEVGGIPEISDPNTQATLKDVNAENKIREARISCLNGIAKKLAKDQLTAMTKYTLNWITTGFNGDPMYVRNIDSFVNNMGNSIIKKELSLFDDANYYPYAADYSRSKLRSILAVTNFAGHMKQNLTDYLKYGDVGGDVASVIKKYSNDFGMGGWNGWVAFTQFPQNNILGSQLEMTNHLAEKVDTAVQNTTNELNQSGGIFNQKVCVEYAKKTVENKPTTTTSTNGVTLVITPPKQLTSTVTDYTNCLKWETVTPGSAIASKMNTYLNSPERQLELVQTINDALGVLFSVLIKTMQNEGLSSLASNNTDFSTNLGGDPYNSILETDPETGEVFTSSGYSNLSVDLTKELGNTFVHDELIDMGDWDAKDNIPKLYAGVGELNHFYTVKVAGNTELVENGYNGWAIGDRVFFGENGWQNWKKDDAGTKTNPIKKRGIVQIQKDFIVGAKELLAVLPGIMPQLGELDYCIPGPNPGWLVNSDATEDAFVNYVDGLSTDYTPSGGFLGKREYTYIIAPVPNSKIYTTYKDMFTGSGAAMWKQVIETAPFKSIGYATNKIKNAWRGEDNVEKSIALVNDIKEKTLNDLELFKVKYSQAIDKIYGLSGMQKQFVENENTYELKPNPKYLPMATTGLDITKDMNSYNERINGQLESYRSDIVTANANIYKLNQIKDRVSVIIKQAQARRDKNMDEIIAKYNEENNTKLTIDNYKNCIKEENIAFYEDTDIFDGKAAGANERCTNNVDDDLDGLIDGADPDCTQPEICGNGADDDGDGAIDNNDSDCFTDTIDYGETIDYECIDNLLYNEDGSPKNVSIDEVDTTSCLRY